MKSLKFILPDYPRTPHIPYKPNVGVEDIISTIDESSVIFQHNIEVTEKIDGANCGMALYNDEPVIRNRSHILNKGFIKDTPAKKQFTSSWGWFYENKSKFEKLNELGPFSVYGEWMVAQHGVFYNNLPSWFVTYDLYDYDESKFVETKSARRILSECGFALVPQIYFGKLQDFEQLEEFTKQTSAFSKDKQEGVYLKISDDKWITHRFKMVREGFVQGALWNKEKLNKNMINRSKRTPEEFDRRLVQQAYGNLKMVNPSITIEQVTEQLRIKRAAEAEAKKE